MSVAARPPGLREREPLAPLTSLGLGGPAKHFLHATAREDLVSALVWAQESGERVGILGGGSNLVIGDQGFSGLVIRLGTRGIALTRSADKAVLEVQAGEPWEQVVELALGEGLAGLECLTGIPGSTGATPIQNVGAYGQEVSECIDAVEVLERSSLRTHWLLRDACGFAYRDSLFKRDPERFVVLAVRFELRPQGAPSLRYAELTRALAMQASPPSLRQVAETVRGLRAKKSMLLDPSDENGRSVGSFFTNPVVTSEVAAALKRAAVTRGCVQREEDVPSFAAGPGQQKLSAAWLIEQAGIAKGLRRGAVGVSSKHTLALVHHGGGSTRELLALADEVRSKVRAVFGVELVQEPVNW